MKNLLLGLLTIVSLGAQDRLNVNFNRTNSAVSPASLNIHSFQVTNQFGLPRLTAAQMTTATNLGDASMVFQTDAPGIGLYIRRNGVWTLISPGDFYSPEMFGTIDTTGATDNTTIVSNALTLAASRNIPLVLTPGVTYKFSAIKTPSNSRIIGYGSTVTQICIPNIPSNYGTASTNPGAPAIFPKSSPAFMVARATNVVIEGIKFTQAPYSTFFTNSAASIETWHSFDVRIENNIFAQTNNHWALNLASSKRINVRNNNFGANIIQTGQSFDYVDTRWDDTNIFTVIHGTENLEISNNLFLGANTENRARIHSSGVVGPVIKDNIFIDVNSVRDLMVIYVADRGLRLYDGTIITNFNPIITGNYIYNCTIGESIFDMRGQSGAPGADPASLLQYYGYGAIIRDNNVYSTTAQIGLAASLPGLTLENNHIESDGIMIYAQTGDSSDLKLIRNYFGRKTDTNVNGFISANAGSTNASWTLTENIFKGNTTNDTFFNHATRLWPRLTLVRNEWHNNAVTNYTTDGIFRLTVTNSLTIDGDKIFLHGLAYDDKEIYEFTDAGGTSVNIRNVQIIPVTAQSVYSGLFSFSEGHFQDNDLGAARFTFSTIGSLTRNKFSSTTTSRPTLVLVSSPNMWMRGNYVLQGASSTQPAISISGSTSRVVGHSETVSANTSDSAINVATGRARFNYSAVSNSGAGNDLYTGDITTINNGPNANWELYREAGGGAIGLSVNNTIGSGADVEIRPIPIPTKSGGVYMYYTNQPSGGGWLHGAGLDPTGFFRVGHPSSNFFRVNTASGDITRIKGLAYVWPSAHVAGLARNDGSGNLSWMTTGLGITNIGNILSNNIVAGANVTITAGANGQLTIASTGGGGGSVLVNGASVTDPNLTNSSTLFLDVTDSTNVFFYPTNLANAQISASAAIARSKIAAGTADHIVINDGSGNLTSEATLGAARVPAFTGGDVTSAGGTLALTIPNDTVTYAKMQNVSAADRLLGRGNGGGAGDVQEISLGSNLSLSGTTLNASDTTANWVAEGTTNSTLVGQASLHNVVVTNTLNLRSPGAAGTFLYAGAPSRLYVRDQTDGDFGELYAASTVLKADSSLSFTGRSVISSPGDGSLLITDNDGSGFAGRLMFGGTSATSPALKLATGGTNLLVRAADDSADAWLLVTDDNYGVDWDNNNSVPTKNNVYDKIETLAVAGADTEIQFNNSGAFGADAGLTYNLSTDAVTTSGSPGANTAPVFGFRTVNSNAATAGNQQYSGYTYWEGQGWKTTATAESQSVAYRAYVVPVQGSSAPSGLWTIEASIAGGAFGNAMTYSSGGTLTVPVFVASGNIFGSGNLQLGASGQYQWNGRGLFLANANNQIQARQSSNTAISGMQHNPFLETKTTAYTVVVLDAGKTFDNIGATARVDFTLPAAVRGDTFTFCVDDTDGLRIISVGDDVIQWGTSVTAAAGSITSTTVGSSITITAVSATKWFATSLVGTWGDP